MAKKPTAKAADPVAETPEVAADPVAEAAVVEADGQVTQRKVGRGSRRRIRRALDDFENAMTAMLKELDLQIFLADGEGNRIAGWPIIADMKTIPDGIRAEVNKVLADNEPAE